MARWGKLRSLWRGMSRRRLLAAACAGLICVALLAALGIDIYLGQTADAALTPSLPPTASCQALATVSRSATNGPTWGRTLLPGHDAPGGWFGVDVCGNGSNLATPNPANVSCDHTPQSWAASGCAPGNATSDGYGLSFQCVELAVRFTAWAFGDQPGDWGRSGWGNAPDVWLSINHPSGYIMYPNGSAQPPVPGDLIVWGALDSRGEPMPAGPDNTHGGHIAIAAAVRDGMVITAEQNVKWGSADRPSDRLALTQIGSRWILSGSTAHETVLPTFRWAGSMGTSRATYGWLHNVRNTGVFPAVHPQTRFSVASTRTMPQQPSGGLPSLASAAFVTTTGMLTDLVWSAGAPFDTSASTGDAPHATQRNLGAPDGTRLVPGQTPAVIALPDGRRFVYVVGVDGRLYAAYTSPTQLGIAWQDLGAPDGVALAPSLSATSFADGVAVAVLDVDGNLWWRAGPDGRLGGWLALGHPTGAALTPALTIVGAPGSGSPLMLAVGANALLYERIWKTAIQDSRGTVQVPAGWSDWIALHNQPAGVRFAPQIVAVPEATAPHALVGRWQDAPLSAFLLDTTGKLWWLRTRSLAVGWTLAPIPGPAVSTSLLAGTLTVLPGNAALAHPKLNVYTATASSTYLVALDLPSRTFAGAGPKWTTLPALRASDGGITATALTTSATTSALLIGDGAAVDATGVSGAADVLAARTVDPTAVSASPAPGWLPLGTLARSAPFPDAFAASTPDPRWVVSGQSTSTSLDGGLRVLAGANATAALLQTAPAGNAALTLRLTPPTTGVHAGLGLYLDDGDWLTLFVDASGTVQLCGVAWQHVIPCQSASITLGTTQAVSLRLTRMGDTFSASASLDGVTWIPVAAWTPSLSDGLAANASAAIARPAPVHTPAATDVAPAGATPQTVIAPLAFTVSGLIVVNDSTVAAGTTFMNYTLSSPVGSASAGS